jgi:hypothetical protein
LDCGTPLSLLGKGFAVYPVYRVDYSWSGEGKGYLMSEAETKMDKIEAGVKYEESAWSYIPDYYSNYGGGDRVEIDEAHRGVTGRAMDGSKMSMNLTAHFDIGYQLVAGTEGNVLATVWPYKSKYQIDGSIGPQSCGYKFLKDTWGMAKRPKNALSCTNGAPCTKAPTPLYIKETYFEENALRKGKVLDTNSVDIPDSVPEEDGGGQTVDETLVTATCTPKQIPTCETVSDCRENAPAKCVEGLNKASGPMTCNCVHNRCVKQGTIYAFLEWQPPADAESVYVDMDLIAFDGEGSKVTTDPDNDDANGWIAKRSPGGKELIGRDAYRELAIMDSDLGGGSKEFKFKVKKLNVNGAGYSKNLQYRLHLYYGAGLNAENLDSITGFMQPKQGSESIDYVFKPSSLDTGCESNADCACGQICDTSDGRCDPGCDNDTDCCGSSVCNSGTCEVPERPDNYCDDNADCPSCGMYCNTSRNRCMSGCRGDGASCCDGKSCIRGLCVIDPCEDEGSCPIVE